MKKLEVYGIIYLIRNKINNKIYIGQTIKEKGFCERYNFSGVDIERVYKSHLYNKEHNKSYNVHLLNSIEKYGFEAFEVDEEFDIAYSKEELDKLEDLYIKVYNTVNKDYGYNNKYGGANGKHTRETKQYLRDINLGENNPMYGKCWTDKQKKVRSDNIKGENNPFYGKHHSEESRKKISKSRQGKYKGKNSPRAKAIYCYELDEIRLCAKDWCEELEINAGNISEVCKGNRKQTHGYHFRYATEEEIEEYKIKHEYKGSDL